MARKADIKTVTPKMYRHFAAVTLAATVALALMSSGENREAIAREVVAAQQGEPESTAGHPTGEAAPSASHATGGSDVAFGTPTSPLGGSGTVNLDGLGIGLPANYTKHGVSAAEWEKLTPEQRKTLKEKLASEKQAAETPEREQQIESLLARSAARSGGTDLSD